MTETTLANRHQIQADQTRMLERMNLEGRRHLQLNVLALSVVALAVGWSMWGTGFSVAAIWRGLPNIASFFWYDLLPPNPAAFTRYLYPALETLMMAYIAAVVAAFVSIGLGVLGARTLMPFATVRVVSRAFVTFLRAVPDVVWGVLLVGIVGLGPFAGVIALTFGAIGMLGRNFADALEDIEVGQIEALRATGANPWQVFVQAVWPQFLPAFITWSFYRFDLNIRSAAIVGMIGGGGLGFTLQTNIRLFQYGDAAMGILFIFAMIMAIEFATERLRDQIIRT